MAYTSHGHHIPGTVAAEMPPNRVARCGGTRMCNVCKADAESYFREKEKDNKVTMITTYGTVNEGVEMVPIDFVLRVKEALRTVLGRDYLDKGMEVPDYEVYVTQFSKTLQHCKAMVATDIPDGKYYEVTYDGDKQATYVDEYVKLRNICIQD